MKRFFYPLLILILGCASLFAQQTFTDKANTTHTDIPDSINRIADAWGLRIMRLSRC